MGMIEATRTCLGKYVTFSGRAGRAEFWWFVLAMLVISLFAGVLDALLFGTITTTVTEVVNGETREMTVETSRSVFGSIAQVALFLPGLAAAWRRMHDTGRRGIVLLVPWLISFATFVFLMAGVFGFALLESVGVDPGFLRNLAASLGILGVITAALLQIAMAALILWWLTRPTQPGENEFGPEPAA